jgi:3',5'-cyclic AMP phosphodiesterase CpdA
VRLVVHLSDLHFGRVDERLLQPLIAQIRDIAPDVVVVSGDLTQRARSAQFRQARAFLDELPTPQIVVPGNHDVPLYNVVARFLSPLNKYRKYINRDLEPTFVDGRIAVVGLNSARSLTIKNGRLNPQQLERVRARLAPLPEHLTKIVVTHHPFDLPSDPGDKDLIGRARLAMQTFAACGVDILLAGHVHVGDAGSTAQRYRALGRAALVINAGTATSTRGRGQANSFNVIRIDACVVTVERWLWTPGAAEFEPSPPQRYVQVDGAWQTG